MAVPESNSQVPHPLHPIDNPKLPHYVNLRDSHEWVSRPYIRTLVLSENQRVEEGLGRYM